MSLISFYLIDNIGSSDGKESACNEGDPGLTPGSGRSPGEGNGYPLQYSCLENSMDRGAWRATVHKVAQSQTRLSTRAHTHTHTHSVDTTLIDSSVQFSHSVVSNSLRLHELHHTGPPCPSPTPGVHPNSSPSSR